MVDKMTLKGLCFVSVLALLLPLVVVACDVAREVLLGVSR